jgi:ABC transporter DrrB family efflux protein
MLDPIGQPVINVQNLSRRFGDRIAVQDVSFTVQRSAIFGLLGPNGSGKSTIIRMLLGILPPSGGNATVLGYDVRVAAERIKPRVGYMSQSFSLYGDLTARENIEFYGRIYGLSPQQLARRSRDVIELTGLGDCVTQFAKTLSGGWKQRLALACALVHEPDLLFLDEPTAGIDPVARRQLWDLLFELSGQGVTLFVTTHYMDEAERCSDVGYIYMSRLLVLGKPHQLKELPEVTPQGTQRLELRVDAPSTRLAQLRKLEGVLDATLFGEAIHVLIDANLNAAHIVNHLGIDVSEARIRPVQPSLEDVFVTLTKSAERSASSSDSMDLLESTIRLDPPPKSTATHIQPSNQPPDHRQSKPREADSGIGSERRLAGFTAILTKEFSHVRRQPSTLFFLLVVPLIQTIIFGFALDTQVEHIPTVVYDQDGRLAARELIEAFRNTRRFSMIERAYDDDTFRRAMTSGRAKVGLRIPPNYSDRLLSSEQVSVQLLVDGSDSQVATTALNTAQLLGLNLSIAISKRKGEASQWIPARDDRGRAAIPIDIRPRLLYNPDLESSHFFVPGLVGIILQLVTVFLTSFAVVRERELGTLEQLFVTPVSRGGLLLGKLVPYAILGFIATLIVLSAMVFIFGVPIHGSLSLLLSLTLLFMTCSLGLGLLVSTVAKTQLEALQFAFLIMLPSVLLSGFMFPRAEMPLPIYVASFAIPVTYFIEILRGVVLRGADVWDLAQPIAGLMVCNLLVLGLAIARFRKQLA